MSEGSGVAVAEGRIANEAVVLIAQGMIDAGGNASNILSVLELVNVAVIGAFVSEEARSATIDAMAWNSKQLVRDVDQIMNQPMGHA